MRPQTQSNVAAESPKALARDLAHTGMLPVLLQVLGLIMATTLGELRSVGGMTPRIRGGTMVSSVAMISSGAMMIIGALISSGAMMMIGAIMIIGAPRHPPRETIRCQRAHMATLMRTLMELIQE